MTTTFAVVGTGWRAAFFWELAAGLDDVECVGAITSRPRRLPLPAYGSLAGCLSSARPDLVVTAVPWAVTPDVVRESVAAGVPVLAETPPAPDLPGLRHLWQDVGASGLVQVAEQYLLMPGHAAPPQVVHDGVIGDPTAVLVCSTHLYHAVSMIRGRLGVGFTPAVVHAQAFTAPLSDPLTPA